MMTVRVRFFARFRELFGTDIPVRIRDGTTLIELVQGITSKNHGGYDAIFKENGTLHEFVIIMRNGKRVETGEAGKIIVHDNDEIAIFPPVAGG